VVRKRKLVAATLGALSTGMGALIHMQTRQRLFVPQLLLNEFSWIPTLIGGTALGLSAVRTSRSKLGLTLGLSGVGLSAVPLLQVRKSMRAMEAAMREGLGAHYDAQIPAEMQTKIARSRLSLRHTVGTPRRLRVVSNLDVVYAQPGERALKLDVYQPAAPPAVGTLYPALIVIHGGSWRAGDKGGLWAKHSRYLAAQGYVVFDIQYRLSHEARWPAQLDDVRGAVRWVKEHADAYNIDPERIAIYGRSAGGHLGLSAAYRAHEVEDDTSVRAVVAIYPPTDLRLWGALPDSPLTWLLGGMTTEVPEVYADASPVEFCRDALPTTLIVQGDKDNLVYPAHGERLMEGLRCTNTRAVMLRVPWARHGFDALMAGIGAQIAQYHIDRFLAYSLYGDAQ
jgi:acetyl esterase/lipase